jgi:uncharacterized integral membrane protein
MGEKIQYQPLTVGDKISVILYRSGLVFITVLLLYGAFYLLKGKGLNVNSLSIYLVVLHIFTGLSVINIHLYVKRFRYFIRGLYALSLIILCSLLIWKGLDFGDILIRNYGMLILLLPLSGCIAFFGIKEAFCFHIKEGYISALLLILFVISLSVFGLQSRTIGMLFLLTSLIYTLFILKKIFMPLAFDIGDKSAYE